MGPLGTKAFLGPLFFVFFLASQLIVVPPPGTEPDAKSSASVCTTAKSNFRDSFG